MLIPNERKTNSLTFEVEQPKCSLSKNKNEFSVKSIANGSDSVKAKTSLSKVSNDELSFSKRKYMKAVRDYFFFKLQVQ